MQDSAAMDFETPDGSRFSLHEMYEGGDSETFDYTSVSGYVDGIAYVARLDQRADEIDYVEVLEHLKAVPLQNIYPQCPAGVLLANESNTQARYLKSPSFEFEDAEPGQTFIADCVLNEVLVYEMLREKPHRNIARYHGCVVKEGRIQQLCLQRYPSNLTEFVGNGVSIRICEKLFEDIVAAAKHLHEIGRAHNDINADNVCVDEAGVAVLVDFDSCLPFGDPILKGREVERGIGSSKENDWMGLDDLHDFIFDHAIDPEQTDDQSQSKS